MNTAKSHVFCCIQYALNAVSPSGIPPVLHSTSLRSAHTAVFMCFGWISEQTAIISLYNIN